MIAIINFAQSPKQKLYNKKARIVNSISIEASPNAHNVNRQQPTLNQREFGV